MGVGGGGSVVFCGWSVVLVFGGEVAVVINDDAFVIWIKNKNYNGDGLAQIIFW